MVGNVFVAFIPVVLLLTRSMMLMLRFVKPENVVLYKYCIEDMNIIRQCGMLNFCAAKLVR